MPAADSERYQSRLFNFFRQKTRNWGEKVQQTFRHAKVNANWSLEAILHSAVLMMRKVVESRGKRLKPGKEPVNTSSQAENHTQIIHQSNFAMLPRGATQGAIAILDRAIAKLESFLYNKPNNTSTLRINTSETLPLTTLPPETPDPWLTLDDLFGDSQQPPSELAENETNTTISDVSKISSSGNWRKPYQQLVKKVQTRTELVQQQSSNLSITPVTTTSSVSAAETSNNQLETQPEWIETPAQIVGYAQHPLERILQFLDNGMLWLEEKIATVFRVIQRLWCRK